MLLSITAVLVLLSPPSVLSSSPAILTQIFTCDCFARAFLNVWPVVPPTLKQAWWIQITTSPISHFKRESGIWKLWMLHVIGSLLSGSSFHSSLESSMHCNWRKHFLYAPSQRQGILTEMQRTQIFYMYWEGKTNNTSLYKYSVLWKKKSPMHSNFYWSESENISTSQYTCYQIPLYTVIYYRIILSTLYYSIIIINNTKMCSWFYCWSWKRWVNCLI